MLPLVCVSLVVRNKRKCPFTCLACFHGKGVNEKSSAADSSCRHDLKFGEIARLFARPRQRNVYLNACCMYLNRNRRGFLSRDEREVFFFLT